MRDLAEYVGGMLDRFRHTSPEMGIVRVALLVVSTLLVMVVRSWTGTDVGGVLLWLAALLILVTTLRPESPGTAGYLLVVGLWWLAGSSAAEAWQHVTVAVLLGAVHILAAQADAIPSHASLSSQAAFTSLVGSGGYVVVVGLAALLVLAVASGGAALASVPLAITAGVLLATSVVAGVLLASRQ